MRYVTVTDEDGWVVQLVPYEHEFYCPFYFNGLVFDDEGFERVTAHPPTHPEVGAFRDWINWCRAVGIHYPVS